MSHRVFLKVRHFFQQRNFSDHPFLLAFSGGPDSLALFHCLLQMKDIRFAIAHVDHGWRTESAEESNQLKEIAAAHAIPFHLKTLDPKKLSGNLEAACREERYAFFSELCREYFYQGVLTGHHADDRAETILKRVLEGSEWSRWDGLKEEVNRNGLKLWRPFIECTKKEIADYVMVHSLRPFYDTTNEDLRYLRPRIRQTIFPYLNEVFGKEVQKNLLHIGVEARELNDYFHEKFASLLSDINEGPWGIHFDLQGRVPESLLEIKYLVKIFFRSHGVVFSRLIIEQIAAALKVGSANQVFKMGGKEVQVDRCSLFIVNRRLQSDGEWMIQVDKSEKRKVIASTWKEAWKGEMVAYLPQGHYTIRFLDYFDPKLRKRWGDRKVPAFLYGFFPFLFEGDRMVHEFLTGESFVGVDLPCKEMIQVRVFFLNH